MTEPVESESQRTADEERRRRRLADPDVQAKVREIKERIGRADDHDRAVGADELPDILRDYQ
jgi:hypothetical protein